MRITHYLYNAFLIEEGNKKIAIDPGALFLYYFRLTTLIPKSEWEDITHIFVTHGDPDHYWHADRVAEASGAAVICNNTMLSDRSGERFMLSSRNKGLTFTTRIKNVQSIAVDETVSLDFFTVPTATFKVLFILMVLSNDRRRILYFNVTQHPTAEWTARQLLEACELDDNCTGIDRDSFIPRLNDKGVTQVVCDSHFHLLQHTGLQSIAEDGRWDSHIYLFNLKAQD